MTGFAQSIRAFGEKADQRIDFVKRHAAFEVFRLVMTETPVDKGTARTNWFITVGSPSEEIVPAAFPGEKGSTAAQNTQAAMDRAMNSLIPGQAVGADIWITNNLPYIVRLEQGHSEQGAGFVAAAMLAVPQIVDEGARLAQERFR